MIASFNNTKIKIYWIDLDQPGLTCQIHDPGYETMITPYKTNQNKLQSLIFNQLNIEK